MKELVFKKTEQGDLRIRVYEPDNSEDTRPAILFFSGGAWRSGELDQFKAQSEHLVRHGVVAACAEYRVSERHSTTPIESVEDGRSAYRWMKTRAADFGIDPTRIAAAGGSAGGHVALCVSLADSVNAASDDLSVICDPSLFVLFNPACETLSRADRFGSQKMARSVSPIHLLEDRLQPSILFYGSEDEMFEEGRAFVEKARVAGAESELHIADGRKHAFFNHSPWRESTTDLMHTFLHRHRYVSTPSDVAVVEAAAMREEAIA